MKKLIHFIIVVSHVLFSISLIACSGEEKYLTSSEHTEGYTSLHVRSLSDDITPEVPVHIYAFNEAGECIDLQIAQSLDENFSFILPLGKNKLYVIAGASPDKYTLPDKSEATTNSVLTLKEPAQSHTELLAGGKEVIIEGKENEEIIVMIDRIVSQITARIEDVPSDITAVDIHMIPLEEEVLLDGTYGGEGNGEMTIKLIKKEEGLWETPAPEFVLPGTDDVIVKIIFTNAEGSENFTYDKGIPIEANHKTEITATYKAGVQDISGSIRSSDWAGIHEVKFEFGEGAEDKENENDEKLAIYDIYKNCLVIDIIEESKTQSTVLLMAKVDVSNLSLSNLSDIKKYSHEGIDNWRLPNEAEAQLLYTMYNSKTIILNDILQEAGIAVITSGNKYLCTDESDNVHYFVPGNSNFKLVQTQSSIKYNARIVNEVTVEYN